MRPSWRRYVVASRMQRTQASEQLQASCLMVIDRMAAYAMCQIVGWIQAGSRLIPPRRSSAGLYRVNVRLVTLTASESPLKAAQLGGTLEQMTPLAEAPHALGIGRGMA